MRRLTRRAAVAAGAAGVLLGGPAVGMASASSGPVLAFTPAPYNYQEVNDGQTTSQTFALANSGGRASRALTVTITGSAEYTITADTCSGTSLGPGYSCTVTVQFAPTAAGTATATLTAANNKKEVLATDPLTGTGVSTCSATGPRVPGKIGSAVKLAGNGEYVALPADIVSGLHDFTVAAWVNPSQNSAWSRIFDFGAGTNAYMYLTLSAGGGPIRFAITASGTGAEQQLNGPSTLPLNTWSQVTVTLSGTTGTLFVNGQPVATNTNMTLTPADLADTTQNWIGRSQFPTDPFLNATVDDFNIYSRALSAFEVATLASGQPGAGDVADYKFDEAGGATALDSSGNGRNATIICP